MQNPQNKKQKGKNNNKLEEEHQTSNQQRKVKELRPTSNQGNIRITDPTKKRTRRFNRE